MKELKFIHITKCAGTSIENLGQKYGYNWGKYHYDEYGWWHQKFPDKNKELKEKYDWFVTVRNPYERILSEYYCKWGGIGDTDIKHTKEEFNQYLIEKIKERNDAHYMEQYKYIEKGVKIYIIKLENLQKDLTTLFKLYNLNIDVNELQRDNTKKENSEEIKFYIKDFNNELIQIINQVYHNDFIIFGYEKIQI